MKTQWWLAELDVHGNAKLVDGPHYDRKGVERAKYLFTSLGFDRDRSFACAKLILSDVKGSAVGVNKKALNQLNAMGLQP